MRLVDAANAYVAEMSGNTIIVKVVDGPLPDALRALGFRPAADGASHSLVARDLRHKTDVISHIRDAGIPFSFGPGWAPSEVFAYLRDQGALQGPYKKIAWRGADNVIVTEE